MQGQGTDVDDVDAQLNEEEQLLVIGRLHQVRPGPARPAAHRALHARAWYGTGCGSRQHRATALCVLVPHSV
jgi:hypothetical protein